MTWYLNDNVFTENDIPDDVLGFVYCITNLKTSRKYIGKKIFFNTIKRPPLKGKKRKRITKVNSDWQKYYGSNEVLKEELLVGDESDYKREILYLCKNKTEMAYLETKEQFNRGVLLSDDYYNSWISAKITSRGLDGLKV